MFERFAKRSEQLELLDTGDYSAEEYHNCIVELQRVNKWLGDARALKIALLHQVKRLGLTSFSMLDVGAGSGELLRVAADWAEGNSCRVRLVGVELNPRAAIAIIEESKSFGNIASVQADALRLPFSDDSFDYAVCSLFTHHLKDPDVCLALREMGRVARLGIIVIDLHRHPLPYYLFSTIGHLFLHNRLIRADGALSILRSFKPDELRKLAEEAGLTAIEVAQSFPARIVVTAHKRLAGNQTTSAGPVSEARAYERENRPQI